MILFLLGKYRRVGLLDHMVNHIRNSQGVFQMAVLFLFPQRRVRALTAQQPFQHWILPFYFTTAVTKGG